MESEIILRLEAFLKGHPSDEAVQTWINSLPPNDRIECSLHMLRKGPTSFVRVTHPEHIFRNASKLSDEELFQQLAQAHEDSWELSSEGNIRLLSPRENPGPMNRFASLYNEAVSRGFQREDIGFAIHPYLVNLGAKLRAIHNEDTGWASFEKLVARIHIALCRDAEVRWSERMLDKSGRYRQIDVTVRSKVGPHKVLGIVQCKHMQRPVSITDVESFAITKADLNADFAVMVSNNGFQRGGIEKARLYNIRLWTLKEAEKVAWKDEIRTYVLFFHYPTELMFHPPLPADFANEPYLTLELLEVTVHQAGMSNTLQHVRLTAMQQATERCLPIPCWYDLNMPPGTTLRIKSAEFPLERISFHFTSRMAVEQQKPLRVPFGTSYTVSQSDGESFRVTERDLPPLGSK